MKHFALAYLGAGLALTALACGGSGDDVDCSFVACGGDPVGTWSIDGACIDTSSLEDSVREFCPTASVSVGMSMAGTITFDSDNTYSVESTLSQTGVITLPSECLAGQQVTSCAQLNDNGIACTGDPSSQCRCTISNSEENMESGNWSVDGNILTVGEPLEFCQDGDVMKARAIQQDPDDLQMTIVLSRL